jgi:hypothetical protein
MSKNNFNFKFEGLAEMRKAFDSINNAILMERMKTMEKVSRTLSDYYKGAWNAGQTSHKWKYLSGGTLKASPNRSPNSRLRNTGSLLYNLTSEDFSSNEDFHRLQDRAQVYVEGRSSRFFTQMKGRKMSLKNRPKMRKKLGAMGILSGKEFSGVRLGFITTPPTNMLFVTDQGVKRINAVIDDWVGDILERNKPK